MQLQRRPDGNLIGKEFPKTGSWPDFHKELFVDTIADVNKNGRGWVGDPEGSGMKINPHTLDVSTSIT